MTNTSSGLPSLPRIRSQPILEQIFTHRSLFRRPKRVFEDSPSEANLDNEQWVTCYHDRDCESRLKILED
jgi:hypothetical protein